MKRLFLVADNRDAPNWGCRSTSISLYSLLSTKFQVSGIITRSTVGSQLPVGGRFLDAVHLGLLRRAIIAKGSSTLIRLLGIQEDVVVEDPRRSATNILNHRKNETVLDEICEGILGSDLVVVNGEGSMIFSTPPRRDLLFQMAMIELAAHFNRPVFYVNAMVSDCPVTGRNAQTATVAMEVLSRCVAVSLRDPESLRIARSLTSNLNSRFVPDALFTWADRFKNCGTLLPSNGDCVVPFPEQQQYLGKLDFAQPYICLSATSLAARYPEQAIAAYTRLVGAVSTLGLRVYLVQTCSGEAFLQEVSDRTGTPLVPAHTPILMGGAILANARLYVSGRYHPSIMASLGGTPCIFLAANSHKTASLQEVLGQETTRVFGALPSSDDCEQIVSAAQRLLAAGAAQRDSQLQVARARGSEARILLDIIRA